MLDAAEKLVAELAAKAGIKLDTVAVMDLAQRLVRYGVELVHARAWRDAEAQGAARSDGITTPADAEEYQRR